MIAPLLASAHAARGVHAVTLYLPVPAVQLLAAADATDDALAAAAAADAARRTKSRDAARAAQRQAELEGLASTSADAAAAARALLASGSAATAAGARHGAGHAGVLRVAGTWRRDGTSAAVAAPVDMVPPEVFAEARRVAHSMH